MRPPRAISRRPGVRGGEAAAAGLVPGLVLRCVLGGARVARAGAARPHGDARLPARDRAGGGRARPARGRRPHRDLRLRRRSASRHRRGRRARAARGHRGGRRRARAPRQGALAGGGRGAPRGRPAGRAHAAHRAGGAAPRRQPLALRPRHRARGGRDRGDPGPVSGRRAAATGPHRHARRAAPMRKRTVPRHPTPRGASGSAPRTAARWSAWSPGCA